MQKVQSTQYTVNSIQNTVHSTSKKQTVQLIEVCAWVFRVDGDLGGFWRFARHLGDSVLAEDPEAVAGLGLQTLQINGH